MFGHGCEVDTVDEAQRYAYAAKVCVSNWSKTNPLPRLFALPDDRGLVRPRRKASHGRQPLATTASHGQDDNIRDIMGMIAHRDGEFKLWQQNWDRPGLPEAWGSLLIDSWCEDDPSKSQDPESLQHFQLERTKNQ